MKNDSAISLFRGWVPCILAALTACSTSLPPTVYVPKPVPAIEQQSVVVSETELRRTRMLADLLYDAKRAYDDNRLMVPAGNNAYEYYQQVLQLDPNNEVANTGIGEIALRYIALAEAAINVGEYVNADNMMARAIRLGPDRPEIAETLKKLEQAKKNRVQVHALDPAGLRTQSLELMTQLAEIAQQIQQTESTFLIRARSDEEGRWIYKTMRDAIGGYRLRANIDISGAPAVIVSTPTESSAAASRSE